MREYNPFLKTAIKRKKLSNPLKVLKESELLNGSILDYGCGYGESIDILKEEGYDVVGYDRFNTVYAGEEVLNRRYDTLTCNYVFNVIPSLEEHNTLLEYLKTLSDNIYISVRSDLRAVKDTWVYAESSLGYWTTTDSFQRFYNDDMITELFGTVEYIVNNSSYKLFKLIV